MASTSNLGRQIEETLAALHSADVKFALIGGLALALHGIPRATTDIDLLIGAESAKVVHGIMVGLGYRCLYSSDDAANYLRDRNRIDFLFAHRPVASKLLASAEERHTPFGDLWLVSPEGLIGFKIQALANDPRRTQDKEDIRALLRAHRTTLDMEDIREYFRLFEREGELDEILEQLD